MRASGGSLGFIWIASLAAACGGSTRSAVESAELGSAARASARPRAPAPASGDAATGHGAPSEAAAPPLAARQAAEPAEPTPLPETTSAVAARMVFYEGSCELRAPHPEETLDAATELAEVAGGYLESRDDRSAVLRVPVGAFREVFDRVLELGVVLSRRLSALDVTDRFTDLELRMKTLTASRDRLQALLAQAKTEQQKLALLRDIGRLTREIDQLALQLQTLAKLAAYSRIAVTVVGASPTPVPLVQVEAEGLAWIRRLSPFHAGPHSDGDEVGRSVPAGMVELDVDHHFRAEAADGAFLRSWRRDNEPEGSTDFWVEAIQARLGPEFEAIEPTELGVLAGLRFVHSSDASYRYLVGVRVRDDRLEVVEVYYPSAASEARHHAAVIAALSEVEAS